MTIWACRAVLVCLFKVLASGDDVEERIRWRKCTWLSCAADSARRHGAVLMRGRIGRRPGIPE